VKKTDGTFHSTDGSPGITRRLPVAKLRLVGLILTAVLGSLLVIWVSRATWLRVEGLQGEFSRLKADDFYLGVRMRNDIQQLNNTLLRYRLRGDTNDAAAFRADAQAFKQWLDQNHTNTVTPLSKTFFDQVTAEYNSYLAESTRLLKSGVSWLQLIQGRDFKASYETVQNRSRRLLALCDSFINDQRAAFAGFLKESNDTMTTFKQLLKLLLLLLVALAGALVFLAYRGMIAPLRLQLFETHALIMRQEKLASLGVLAAGVAHEIRNPLTAIKFRLYSLKKSLPPDGSANEDAALIGNEIGRLEHLVQDVLQFARPSEPELATVNVQRILEDVHTLLAPQLKKTAIELKLVPVDPVWVKADTQQIKQVLINLIQNSADSIGSNGRVILRVRHESGPLRRNTVILDVADNGKGIPPNVRKRLFDPFFTTKEGGTGLGLPIAARIVEKHGGELRYRTELRRGTTFSIVLPHVTEYETQNSLDRR
jgi:signal transduction histidine kinase